MVDKSKKLKYAGIILAIILLVGAAVALAVAWGPGNNNSSSDEELADAEAVHLVSSKGTVSADPVLVLEDFIASADKPVFIDFWAEWCGPCKLAEPFIETLATEYEDEAHIIKVNVDEQQAIASAFRVQSIPTFVVIKDGAVMEISMGYADHLQNDLRAMIDNHID